MASCRIDLPARSYCVTRHPNLKIFSTHGCYFHNQEWSPKIISVWGDLEKGYSVTSFMVISFQVMVSSFRNIVTMFYWSYYSTHTIQESRRRKLFELLWYKKLTANKLPNTNAYSIGQAQHYSLFIIHYSLFIIHYSLFIPLSPSSPPLPSLHRGKWWAVP